jgi:hypothetical protein
LEIDHPKLKEENALFSDFFTPQDPVLMEEGKNREQEWEDQLEQKLGFKWLCDEYASADAHDSVEWGLVREVLSEQEYGENCFVREVRFDHKKLGAFQLTGQADFLVLYWRKGEPILRLVETKASRKDRTYHRIQVATYHLLLTQELKRNPLEIAGRKVKPEHLEAIVARIDEKDGKVQSILDTKPLDVSVMQDDLRYLLKEGGILDQALTDEFSSVPFTLDSKCQTCNFNLYCYPEAAAKRDIRLLGFVPSSVERLAQQGINTIDDLAHLSIDGAQTQQLMLEGLLPENPQTIRTRAQVRLRSLPPNDTPIEGYAVQEIPRMSVGQLPAHDQNGEPLVRVYLNVEFDYVEHRIVALSAHITQSEGKIETTFHPKNPDEDFARPLIREVFGQGETKTYQDHIYGISICKMMSKEVMQSELGKAGWSKSAKENNRLEGKLIEVFFKELTRAIYHVANGATANHAQAKREMAPVHFYVWNRSEIKQLAEACARCNSQLTGKFNELLGCRAALEQQIFSDVQSEFFRRFAMPFSSKARIVVADQPFLGRPFHWRRELEGVHQNLEWIFRQSIFDFKEDCHYDKVKGWMSASNSPNHASLNSSINPDAPSKIAKNIDTDIAIETRARHFDGIPAPYWHALWGILQKPKGKNPLALEADHAYRHAANESFFRAFLIEKALCLRWIEDKLAPKRAAHIKKPLLDLEGLKTFSLPEQSAKQASLDFMRFDQHIRRSDWSDACLHPPLQRILAGETLPLSGIRKFGSGKNMELHAQIDTVRFPLDLAELESRFNRKVENEFVRLIPYSGDPNEGVSLRSALYEGSTAIIKRIDWNTGKIILSPFSKMPQNIYTPQNEIPEPFPAFMLAEESIQEFVNGNIDKYLSGLHKHFAFDWFDLSKPQIPAFTQESAISLDRLSESLHRFKFSNNNGLDEAQLRAILDGLSTRVQLLLGPPGTGKTTVTALSVYLRILAFHDQYEPIFISGFTHTAVNTLLAAIRETDLFFRPFLEKEGFSVPKISLIKLEKEPVEKVETVAPTMAQKYVTDRKYHSISIIGGTINSFVKAHNKGLKPCRTLIIDEASMMVYPHLLTLTTFLSNNGQLMLAGDHWQLKPIVAHQWDDEDRPPSQIFKPYLSAYSAVQQIRKETNLSPDAVRETPLEYTFRVPDGIRQLIAPVYAQDQIELRSRPPKQLNLFELNPKNILDELLHLDADVILLVHNENRSQQANIHEANLIHDLLNRRPDLPDKSVAIVAPHRAQVAYLSAIVKHPAVDVIDTVERLQGGERPYIFYSATVSDPIALERRADFYLNLNRANVAFSRAKEKLIVVCSESLLNFIPSELEHYEQALLWKHLRRLCHRQIATIEQGQVTFRVMTM